MASIEWQNAAAPGTAPSRKRNLHEADARDNPAPGNGDMCAAQDPTRAMPSRNRRVWIGSRQGDKPQTGR
jgi:hypothetical protein